MKKSNIKILALAIAALFATKDAMAQYDAMFTQYMFNEMFINPAYAGSKEAMSATLLHRQQWVSFPGRPVTTSFSLHGPLMGNKMGLGLSVLNEKIGVSSRNLIYASYAYRLKLDAKSTLAMGLMGGIENQQNGLTKLKISNDANAPTDPQFSQNSPNIMAPNFGIGLYYNNAQNWYVGLSIPRMIDNRVVLSNGGVNTIKTTRVAPDRFTYYLTGGYVHKVSDELKIKANAMIKAVQNAPMQLDLGGSALINDMFWAGLSYRSNSSLAILLGVQANKQLLINYSYDYGLNKIQKYSMGSHEIVLNYLFSFTGRKIVTPRYF
jgi:type IX secretion system PorP/SprF family membrane protein